MTDSTLRRDPIDQEAEGLDPEDIDTGPPIPQLQSLETPPEPGFLGRLRRRIDRRRFTGDATTLAWSGPWILLRELLEIVFGGGSNKGLHPKSPESSSRADESVESRDASAAVPKLAETPEDSR